eukprot:1148432_1
MAATLYLLSVLCVYTLAVHSTSRTHNDIDIDSLDTTWKLKAPTSNGEFINSGTPGGVPLSFDCAVREYAYQYGMSLQPRHGTFIELFDALQLHACNITRPSNKQASTWTPPKHDKPMTTNACIFYVDATKGNDANDGSIGKPLQTIEKGILRVRSSRTSSTQSCTLYLRNSTFYITNPILLTAADSYLTITNYNGEMVTISGGVPLQFASDWELVEYEKTQWQIYNDSNNCFGRSIVNASTDNIEWLGAFSNLNDCLNTVKQAQTTQKYGAINGFCYNDPSMGGGYAGQCYGIHDMSWQPYTQSQVTSGRYLGKNIWSVRIKNLDEIPGLRVNKGRGIRARYPDQITERAMQYDAISGWIPYQTKWNAPRVYEKAENIIYTADDYKNDPNVEWPMQIEGFNTTNQYTGSGNWGEYHIGVGGTCNAPGIEPNYGYYCSYNSPRASSLMHVSPSGIYLDDTAISNYLPNAPYMNVTGAVIHSWRPAHWYTMMWEMYSDAEYDRKSGLMNFSFGGFQGAEGMNRGAEWYIENVFEEISIPNEYFYNQSTNTLYFFYNSSDKTPPPKDVELVATNARVLFNISGSMTSAVKNVTIQGVELRDTRYTYLDPHGMPTGGDWGLQRSGAITIQGSENINIDSSLFTRLDGNAIFIADYNRNITISNNDFEWIGDTVIAQWGNTASPDDNTKIPNGGPDGRNGDQPRFTRVYNNLAREIGLFQKQSSLYFQAASCQNTIENNIFFNGPRAGINFNDGFGGGNIIRNNLIINAVRESGDHGPFNSWDRVPYVTNVNAANRGGKSSIIPAFNRIYQNFIIGTYETQEGIDNDDGSAQYLTYLNFFVYGSYAMKSDFDGNNNYHYQNVYAYIGNNAYGFGGGDTGAYNEFRNNSVVFRGSGGYKSTCIDVPGFVAMGNSLYNPTGKMNVCNTTLEQWVQSGHDPGTTISTMPKDEDVIQWAKDILQIY